MSLLYTPPDRSGSATFGLRDLVNDKYSESLASYEDLYDWSIAHISEFWRLVWDWPTPKIIGICSPSYTPVVDESQSPQDNPTWFSGVQVNFAENLLWCRSPDKIALTQLTEPTPQNPNPPHRHISYAQLYELTSKIVSALLQLGLQPGDRVASYSSNCIENVAAMLASSAIGCVWVSAAADFGPEGVFERLEQVQPKVLFTVDEVVYSAKTHQHLPKVSTLLSKLSNSPTVIVIHPLPTPSSTVDCGEGWIAWDAFIESGAQGKLGLDDNGEIQWVRLPFDWPLWILFSSGTTGKPKPIVHRAGGMLLQSKKELAICADLTPSDVFFYYTTTGWMMWNFLIGGLAIGCTVVLFDGSPLKPDPSYLWRMVDELRLTIFGTSAKYIDSLSKMTNYRPRDHHKLTTLRHIYSTGSPLSEANFQYVYRYIKPDVLLASITGGTDICSLFAGMNTVLPVFSGQLQCRMLGMAVDSFSPTGRSAGRDEPGELVCTKPFPCQPLGFWPLGGFGYPLTLVEQAKKRYNESYFSAWEGIWYHGDHVVLTTSQSGNGGGLIMQGRSDGVLNPGGVRFGSSEIYDVIESLPETETEQIVDFLAIGQIIDNGADERVILFLKLDGAVLDDTLRAKICAEIRRKRSPRHVPAKIIQVIDIPYTLNGKRVEIPIKKIVNGAPLSSINASTLRNPECLHEFVRLGKELCATSA